MVKIINERLDIYFLRLQTYPHYIYQNFIIGLKDILLSFNAFRLLCQFFLALVSGQPRPGQLVHIGNIESRTRKNQKDRNVETTFT